MKIPYSLSIAKFYTVRYNVIDRRKRAKNTPSRMRTVVFLLYRKTEGDMLLLPSSHSVYKPRNIILPPPEGKMIDVEYVGTPTPEQADILNIIKTRIKDYNYYSGLVVMKTGRGKSHSIFQLIDYIKQPTLVVVHNTKALNQMEEKMKSMLKGTAKIGVYYAKRKTIGDIIITTHKSLALKKGIIDVEGEVFEPTVLLYDEADLSISEKMISALCNLQSVKYMYGLTGTPNSMNLNEESLNLIFGKSVSSDLGGYNIIPHVKYIRYRDNSEYNFKSYHELRKELFNNADRTNTQIKYIKHVMKYRKVGLLLTDRINEAVRFFEHLSESEDYDVILIHGDTKESDDNQSLIDTVFSGKKTLIIGTAGKISRGVDIPPIDTIFLFYPNKFESALIQSVGRGLRIYAGKKNVLLVDWCDFPILKKQMYSRWKVYRSEYGLTIGEENQAKDIL